MTVLQMDPSKLPAAGRALFAAMAAKRKARGEGFGGPYIALLNHPDLARRIEELGFFLEVRGRAAAAGLSVHRAHGRARDRRGIRMARPRRARARRRTSPRMSSTPSAPAGRDDAAAALCASERDPGEDDGVAAGARRSAGARRRAMGRGGTGRDRRACRGSTRCSPPSIKASTSSRRGVERLHCSHDLIRSA